jgi:hypothetical protein
MASVGSGLPSHKSTIVKQLMSNGITSIAYLLFYLIDEVTYWIHPYVNRKKDSARPWIAQHLTEEQWRKHRRSLRQFCRHVGKYKNFHAGHLGWLKREGLPPITPEMQAHLEEKNRQQEQSFIDQGMMDELAEWREDRRRRQALIDAIGV